MNIFILERTLWVNPRGTADKPRTQTPHQGERGIYQEKVGVLTRREGR